MVDSIVLSFVNQNCIEQLSIVVSARDVFEQFAACVHRMNRVLTALLHGLGGEPSHGEQSLCGTLAGLSHPMSVMVEIIPVWLNLITVASLLAT